MATPEVTTFPETPAENADLIARFTEYLRVEKGLSKLTIDAYESDLAQLSKEFSDRKLIAARRKGLSTYVGKLLSVMSARSAARKVTVFREFFKFLLMDGVITRDPMLRVETPKGWKTLPNSLGASEINTYLSSRSNEHGYLTRRNQAILELFYAAGLRVSEMAGAKLADLNLPGRYLIVCGKGNKERITPFGHTAAEALRHYLAQRDRLTQDSPLIFVGRRGEQLTRQRLWQIVRARSKAIGRNVGPHMLRHSCATDMVDNGADLRTVQTILGHEFGISQGRHLSALERVGRQSRAGLAQSGGRGGCVCGLPPSLASGLYARRRHVRPGPPGRFRGRGKECTVLQREWICAED